MKGKETASFLTPPELAERWRVRPDRVLTFIRNGSLRPFDVASVGCRRPRYRIPLDAVAEFERARQPKPPEPRAKRRSTPERPAGWIEYF